MDNTTHIRSAPVQVIVLFELLFNLFLVLTKQKSITGAAVGQQRLQQCCQSGSSYSKVVHARTGGSLL
jgi:hypothetical protein